MNNKSVYHIENNKRKIKTIKAIKENLKPKQTLN